MYEEIQFILQEKRRRPSLGTDNKAVLSENVVEVNDNGSIHPKIHFADIKNEDSFDVMALISKLISMKKK
ncbi:hypothetical protein Bhyg_01638 [Pseudolycoriella hygida]|uniref:Uncharacterized protein n=1 Tax=Pseudolycoriella hygida TaxID=35572 RepID=A0A9Q0N9T9_9DIPT|nr:hypothetical protein Bhyg_01638 [Pseudolycoriella hygida]